MCENFIGVDMTGHNDLVSCTKSVKCPENDRCPPVILALTDTLPPLFTLGPISC